MFEHVERICENPDISNFQESESQDNGGSEDINELQTAENSNSSFKNPINDQLKETLFDSKRQRKLPKRFVL